jgi:V/A-type H+-transporting ATPase subunit I
MAIAEMRRIRLYGLESEREAILSELMRFGAVQLEDAFEDAEQDQTTIEAPSEHEERYAMVLSRPDKGREIARIDSLLTETKTALELLRVHAPLKKPMFAIRRHVDRQEEQDILAQRADALAQAETIRKLDDALNERKAEEARVRGRLEFLAPWKGVGLDLSSEGTRYTRMQAGTLPAGTSTKELLERLSQEAPAATLFEHGGNRDFLFCVAFWHKDEESGALGVLKEAGWSRLQFRDYAGDPDQLMAGLQKRLDEIQQEKALLAGDIAAKAPARKQLEALHDTLLMERERFAAVGRLAASERMFLLKGWVPADACSALEKRLNHRFSCHLHHEAPENGADMPVLVRSNGFTEAIRPVMDMYGTPSPKEIDPNFLTLPFFAIFFGLIIADAGYGLILMGASFFVLKRFKLEDSVRRFMKLVLFSGIATTLWGIVFGSFFGIAGLAKYALWFSPTGENGTETLMVWCLAFGVIHLFTGMGLKAANLIRRGQVWDAICDVGFPYIMFTGFAMTVLPYVPGLDPAMTAAVSAMGLYVFAVGVALVLLTSGRKSKSLIGKIFGGLPRLYDIIGFLGDVLSYMRLLALCLAGGILSGLVNDMASDLGNIVARVVGGTILLLFGHGINFAMGILGAFVHSCRLQYLEFFSKFLEGGGTPFRPFGPRTQYIVMKQED